MNEEAIFFRGSPSVLTRAGALFVGFLVMAGALVGAFLAPAPWPYVLGGIAGLAALYLIGVIWVVKATQYEATSERIRIRSGILTKRTEETELYRATDTSLIEPLSMRMFGLGTIEIRTADASTPKVYLNAIHNARNVREELRKHIEACRDRKGVRVTEFENPGPATT